MSDLQSPLISVSELASQLRDDTVRVIDCRFTLGDPAEGRAQYGRSHIPGAVHADLERDLSGIVIPGRTGRHPLPDPKDLVLRIATWGVHNASQVVAYDAHGGAFAARLWWLLRWLGHDRVRVLDGGMPAWQSARLPADPRVPRPTLTQFVAQLRPERVAELDTVERSLSDPGSRLLDARSSARFRGDEEPLDAVAGHIPGAVCLPYTELLGADGRFLAPELLRARFTSALGPAAPEQTIAYCGSGVTACHLLLAAEVAGISGLRLYPGSWSEWITDTRRPVARGDLETC